MRVLEVFADVGCPFAHVGLRHVEAFREQRGLAEPILYVRAWPLELVNGGSFDGSAVAPKVDALRAGVAPDLFAGFDAQGFPTTSLPAMAAERAAYRVGLEQGHRFALAVRQALFDEGRDVSNQAELARLCEACGVPEPTAADEAAVRDDWAEGRSRGVSGSPHFFTPDGDFFCPALDIEHDAKGYEVSFDSAGFQRFIAAVFG